MTHPDPLTRAVQAALDMAADAAESAESCGHCEDIFLAATAIRAIPVAEVLAKVRTRRAECGCGAGDRSWIASGSSGAWGVLVKPDDPEEWVLIHPKVAVDWIERKGTECQPLYACPAPDAVARLVKAVKNERHHKSAYDATPADRGGHKGPKGQAYTLWCEARADVVAALAVIETHNDRT